VKKMVHNNMGFTLIELIVVVIIIGILAAIGAPMYQDLVEKSRGAEAVNALGMFKTAEQAYYLEKGEFLLNVGGFGANSFEKLGCENPTNTVWNYWTDDGYNNTMHYRDHGGIEHTATVDLVIHAQRLGNNKYYLAQIDLGHSTDGRWLWGWTNTPEGPHPGIPNN
jgi:type IV pilus assembly protein PilA